ncbi:hypothetical protein [Modestobacter roseus]|uniref:Uncharacterized protein n=1 Tax=Modestobacter roseus TaxID=1181884 RepID=A0A562ISP8_9ACTN|nr:hypothetical protein [Modestobacter roseus]MQA33899.1 hypothetical protein [Modestobacter roseus]TWH73932.1 hypothetical protein JD78_02461 [Modestobacter roseus]
MAGVVIGGALALTGVLLITGRSVISAMNEKGNRWLGVSDREEKPLDHDRRGAALAGAVLLVAGVGLVVADWLSS